MFCVVFGDAWNRAFCVSGSACFAPQCSHTLQAVQSPFRPVGRRRAPPPFPCLSPPSPTLPPPPPLLLPLLSSFQTEERQLHVSARESQLGLAPTTKPTPDSAAHGTHVTARVTFGPPADVAFPQAARHEPFNSNRICLSSKIHWRLKVSSTSDVRAASKPRRAGVATPAEATPTWDKAIHAMVFA